MLPGIPTADMRWATPVTGSSSTLVVNYPTLVRPDDLVVLIAGVQSATLVTSLGGSWTDDCRHSGTGDTLAPGLYVAHRQGTAALSGTTVTLTLPTGVAQRATTVAIPAVDLATVLDTAAATTFKDQTTAQANNVVPAGTTTRGEALLLGAWMGNAAAHTWTQPTNWTEQIDGDGTRPLEISYFTQTVAGSTGTMTGVDSGTAKSLGQVLVIRPRTASPAQLLLTA